MLTAEGNNRENQINHIMIADKNKRVYCHLLNEVIKWSDSFYQENCTGCQYLYGVGQGVGTIECKFESEVDDEDDIAVVIDDPFLYAQSKFTLGFKVKGKE